MTNRREFLQAAAVSALPVAACVTTAVGAMRASELGGHTLHASLFDQRHPEARAMSTRLMGSGATLHAIDGDVTQVWLQHIGPAWKLRPVGVAGLTERPALFCLEHFALSAGLRVVFHAEHILSADRTEHCILRATQGAACSIHDLEDAGPYWPSVIADAIALHRKSAHRVRLGPSDAALAPTLPQGSRLLTSWIIAAA